ncbi:hypothetical protein Dsin_012731 [Dipteronia sinensis]|uniref:HAT C-terminal dimerisation domain-containing protein n=1 Tax=Dipteronia sinensis TaxID=43782 RepID=A0AAE0AIT2_9ROSI|nr:hypothetical protein Dsin_012731 [Dipteronia sinensis]
MQKKILIFGPIANHKEDTIGKALETRLKSWGIKRVFTVTIDNATSNNNAILYLSKITNSWNGAIINGDHMHLGCSAHILNLIVTEGLKDYRESISKICNMVRYVRGSPARLQKFKSCAKIEKMSSNKLLCLDVPTRWNSTYLGCVWHGDRTGRTGHVVLYCVWKVRDRSVNCTVMRLVWLGQDETREANDNIPIANDMPVDNSEIDVESLFNFGYMKLVKETNGVDNKSEVDQYLMESYENPNDDNFDILCWWKIKSPKYKILSYLVRNILAILVSTIASESAFSTGGRIFYSYRS